MRLFWYILYRKISFIFNKGRMKSRIAGATRRLVNMTIIRDTPVDSRGEGAMEFSKTYFCPPESVSLCISLLRNFRKNIPVPYIVCSKWSCAFLDLWSSECTCTRKRTCFVSRSFNATTIFLQLRHFLLYVFQEVRVGPIKSKLPYMASNVAVIYYRS